MTIEIVKCNHCGKIGALVNGDGECVNNCPGLYTIMETIDNVPVPTPRVHDVEEFYKDDTACNCISGQLQTTGGCPVHGCTY